MYQEPNVRSEKLLDKAVLPRYSGYSSAGTAVQTGDQVQGITPGSWVALAWSTHSQYVCLLIVLKDDGISFEKAVICHIGMFSLAAIRECHLVIGESALVMGLDILGHLVILQLHTAGAVPVIAADPIKIRLSAHILWRTLKWNPIMAGGRSEMI